MKCRTAPPQELIETRTYLLKESRVIGAIVISAQATTKRPESREFQMSNMYGRTEEVFGKSYDTTRDIAFVTALEEVLTGISFLNCAR